MAKFNGKQVRTHVSSPVQTVTGTRTQTNHQGGTGHVRDAKSELFLLAMSNMVSEKTFYEDGKVRDDRYVALVRQVAVEDFTWLRGFLGWLRSTGNMRTASLIGAIESVEARQKLGLHENLGDLVDSVLQRPDEVGEYVAARTALHGKSLSKAERWGLRQAARRMYTQRNVLKYDTASHAFRFADILELAHVKAKDEEQVNLFRYLLNQKNFKDGSVEDLDMLLKNQQWREMAKSPNVYKNALLEPDFVKAAGITWEEILSTLGSVIPKKELWEAVIPSMGHMALIRNLRNFDQEGVSDVIASVVAAKIADPNEVARGKQFPFRYLAAFQAAPSLRWGHALEQALTHSLANVPVLKGSTLVLVDRSGSMWSPMSGKSKLNCADAAAVFGTALALRAENATLVEFGSTSKEIHLPKGGSLLKLMSLFGDLGGTCTKQAVLAHYRGHDRVVIITDEQTSSYNDPSPAVPANIPLYTWNIGGYQYAQAASGPNRHTFGGLTDAAFRQIHWLENAKNAMWPWLDQR